MAYQVLIDLPKDGKAVLLEGYECIGCEGCVSSCPKDAITIVGG